MALYKDAEPVIKVFICGHDMRKVFYEKGEKMKIYILTYIRTNYIGKPLNRGCIGYNKLEEAEKQAFWFRKWGYLDIAIIEFNFENKD